MRHLALGLALATVVGTVAASAQPYNDNGPHAPAGPQVSVGFNVFYDSLSPYGSWVDLDPWGQVWQPSMTPAGWRPYTLGHWAYSDDGWTWISDFEWGWAPFHYGRWFFDPYYGWVWIPGDVWGPAWVAWRWGDGFVGWAPLPAWVGWEVGVGFTIGDFDALIPLHDWVFCGERDLDQQHVREFLFPDRDNDRYVSRTHDVTDFASVNDRVVNRSIDAESIARATGRPVPHFRLMERRLPGPTQERENEHTLELYRPRFIARGENGPQELRGFERGRARRFPPSAGEMRSFQELQRRQEAERRSLEARHQAERERLQSSRHEQPDGHGPHVAPAQGGEELHSLEERQEAERRQLENRQRQALMPFFFRHPEMLQLQQQEEARQLRQQQEMERRNLEERHRQEMANPGQQRPEKIRQRQAMERRQLEERQTQERQQMQQQFARERRQAESHQQARAQGRGEAHGGASGRPH
jgi:hypothetical protein